MAKMLLLNIYQIGCGRHIRHCGGNHNFPSDILNRWRRKLNHFRMFSIRQRRYRTSSICRMMCDEGRIRNHLDI